jgi:hypothetical protein
MRISVIKIYFFFLIIGYLQCCDFQKKKLDLITIINAESNSLLNNISSSTNEYRTFYIGITYLNNDTLLQILPLKNNCIPKLKRSSYLFQQNNSSFIFTNKKLLKIIFNQYKSKLVKVEKCNIKFDCPENSDCPVMLIKVEKKSFKMIKGFYW